MTDLRHQTIMRVRRNLVRSGSDCCSNIPQNFERAARRGLNGAEKVMRTPEEIRVCGFRSGMFKTRHRMPADERNSKSLSLIANRNLRAADIRDQHFF